MLMFDNKMLKQHKEDAIKFQQVAKNIADTIRIIEKIEDDRYSLPSSIKG